MHWSEQIAREAISRVGPAGTVVVNSGVSLSAPVHIGHSREFITAALIFRAVRGLGHNAKLIAYADDLDPLRKVYGFLPKEYERWVGCPLSRIPDPKGCHENYAEHHLEQLLEALGALSIEPIVVRSSSLYRAGKCAPYVRTLLNQCDRVNDILDRVSKRNPNKGRWPFTPECPTCFSITETSVREWDGDSHVMFSCSRCNQENTVDIRKGGGKLSWRTDWPLRWALLDVTVEPFGQDHNSAGGSYESGSVIARDALAQEPPIPVPYAWLHLKSSGAMHSSGGRVFSVAQAIETYPREILWWMVAKRKPLDIIKFDPVESQLEEARSLRDTVIGKEATKADALRVVQDIVGVSKNLTEYPRDHLVLATQLAEFDPDKTLSILRRSSAYVSSNVAISQPDLDKIKVWLETVAPRYRICMRSAGDARPVFSESLQPVIEKITTALETIEWSSEAIHNRIHDVIREEGYGAGEVFAELYRLTIGQSHGPKMGWMFEALGRERVIVLLK